MRLAVTEIKLWATEDRVGYMYETKILTIKLLATQRPRLLGNRLEAEKARKRAELSFLVSHKHNVPNQLPLNASRCPSQWKRKLMALVGVRLRVYMELY
jgi:hypothetical protein